MQVDHRDTRVGLVVYEHIAAIVITLGLGNGRVVSITIGDVLAIDTALRQHGLGFVIKAVALPGLGGKHADILENTHGRDAIDDQLATLPARTEHHVFIATAGRCIGLGCRQNILFRQSRALSSRLSVIDADHACPAKDRPSSVAATALIAGF